MQFEEVAKPDFVLFVVIFRTNRDPIRREVDLRRLDLHEPTSKADEKVGTLKSRPQLDQHTVNVPDRHIGFLATIWLCLIWNDSLILV